MLSTVHWKEIHPHICGGHFTVDHILLLFPQPILNLPILHHCFLFLLPLLLHHQFPKRNDDLIIQPKVHVGYQQDLLMDSA